MKRVVPRPGMRIREDTSFEPGAYDFGAGDGITIDADDIVVDGGGAELVAHAPPPPLPEGDCLYSPGDLGVSREIHELLARRISVPRAGSLLFQFRSWGSREDPASVAVSKDRKDWRVVPGRSADQPGGWRLRRFDIGAGDAGDLSLRLSVPAAAMSPSAPLFYDAFRLLLDDSLFWEGDARGHWDRWYNTGFTIFRREGKRFYTGTALRAEGRKGITLRNVRVRGFLTGLHLRDCAGWTIEDNDFSDNYDDPDYGWGEGTERFGGIILEDVSRTTVRRNRGRRVWNGIALRRCDENTIEANEFSHCSNTCLKMSQSSRNLVQDNVLSWGLRIYPGEVHARDSVSLLVESGSDENRFLRNDFTHGGDGIFIRVLDHWCSVGNLFEGNDCSHANNNAVESWSPRTTYVGNRANGSSYGFWLGGSDETVLRDNEVMDNGKALRNAPEPFGNAGVSVVHGPSSGFLVAGNRIVDNAGPGISVAYREESPARLWLIAGNEIAVNRNDPRGYAGHGIFLEHCADVVVAANRIAGNEGRDILIGRAARQVTIDSSLGRVMDGLAIRLPARLVAGEEAEITLLGGAPSALTAADSLRLSWDFGDGIRAEATGTTVRHVFGEPGRRRLTVTAVGGGAAGIATKVVCIHPRGTPVADCGNLERWRLSGTGRQHLRLDAAHSTSGGACLEAVVRGGTRSTLATDLAVPLDLSAFRGVSFFYRYSCDLSILSGRRTRTVGLRLVSEKGALELIPDTIFKGEPSEDRYEWVYFDAPREALRAVRSPDETALRRIEIVFGPDAPADCIFRVDSLMTW